MRLQMIVAPRMSGGPQSLFAGVSETLCDRLIVQTLVGISQGDLGNWNCRDQTNAACEDAEDYYARHDEERQY